MVIVAGLFSIARQNKSATGEAAQLKFQWSDGHEFVHHFVGYIFASTLVLLHHWNEHLDQPLFNFSRQKFSPLVFVPNLHCDNTSLIRTWRHQAYGSILSTNFAQLIVVLKEKCQILVRHIGFQICSLCPMLLHGGLPAAEGVFFHLHYTHR
jgi:hypothetical protein